MAAVCDLCGKGPGFGKSVSHSHRRTNRRWNPNIQSVRVEVAPGNRKRKNVCTSCLKAGKTSVLSRRHEASTVAPHERAGRRCLRWRVSRSATDRAFARAR